MHCVRRSALRILTSSSKSIVSKSSSLPTVVPLHRNVPAAITAPVSRCFSINAVKAYAQQEGDAKDEPVPTSADPAEQSSVSEAVSSITEAMSTAASTVVPDSTVNGPVKSDVQLGREEIVERARVDAQERKKDVQIVPTSSVYIGNLYFGVTEPDLKELFSPYGHVLSTKVIRDSRGLSKGFGYVEFEEVDHATAAINAQDGEVYAGRRIVVNYVISTNAPRKQAPPTKTIFIGNLPYEMSDADLNRLFREIRNVIDVRVAIDRRTGQPRGFAHADFVDVPSAEEAMKFLNGKIVYGRPLRCDFAAYGTKARDSANKNKRPGSSDDSEAASNF